MQKITVICSLHDPRSFSLTFCDNTNSLTFSNFPWPVGTLFQYTATFITLSPLFQLWHLVLHKRDFTTTEHWYWLKGGYALRLSTDASMHQ